MSPFDAIARGWAAPPRPVWEERPSRTGTAAKATVLGAACLAVLFPLWIVVVTSLSSRRTITEAGGLVVVPGTSRSSRTRSC